MIILHFKDGETEAQNHEVYLSQGQANRKEESQAVDTGTSAVPKSSTTMHALSVLLNDVDQAKNSTLYRNSQNSE